MRADSDHLGSGRVSSDDIAELSSPFTCGGARQVAQSYYLTVDQNSCP